MLAVDSYSKSKHFIAKSTLTELDKTDFFTHENTKKVMWAIDKDYLLSVHLNNVMSINFKYLVYLVMGFE